MATVNFDLKTYYNNFNSEELEQIEKQLIDLSKLQGMAECLEQAEKELGKDSRFCIILILVVIL